MSWARQWMRRPAVIGCLLVVCFGLMAWWMPERGARMVRHVVTTAGAILLIACFVLGRRAAAGATLRPVVWWGWGSLALGAACLVSAFHSSDVHAYVQTGWLQTQYQANPYVTRPVDVPGNADDPMFSDTWRRVPCVYGPLFALIARGPAALSGGDPAVARTWFRVLNALLVLLIAWLIWSSHGGGRAQVRAMYPWLWSPFVLLHACANAHNDVWFAFFVLASLVAARCKYGLLVLPLLTLATLTKIVAVVLLPLALVWTWRTRGPRTAGWATLVSVLVAAGIVAPFAVAPESLQLRAILAEWTQPANSLTASMAGIVRALAGGAGTATEVMTLAMRGLLLGTYAAWWAVTLIRAMKSAAYDVEQFLVHSVAALLFLLVLVSAKFHPWYLLMVLPSALLLPASHPLRRATVLLTITWMLAFTGLGKARIVDYIVMTAVPMIWFIARERRRARTWAQPS